MSTVLRGSSQSTDSAVIRVSPANGRVYVTHIFSGDVWNFTKP